MSKIKAFRCLVWVGLSGGDGAEVEFAAGQVDHGAEVAHVLESAGSGLDVLDDAVESFEDRVGVGVVEVGEDVPPVAAYLAGELFHGFESGARHPRAQTLEGRLGLGSIGAGVVDVLEGLAHLTGASGFQSSPLQAALGFQLQAGQVRFVPQPQVLGPLEQRVAAGLLFADLVDGLVGVFDHVELVDDSRRVGQPLADALGEPQAHVAGNQTHPVGIAVVIHEIPREPFDRGRVLARDHADYVALHQVGDHGDVPVALPAGLVDAYGLHARVVLVKPRLVHVMADEPPQAGVMFADLLGDVRDRLAFGQLHDHRLEQEREPASRPRPRHRDRVHAVGGARHARHARVNERLVLEEVQMPPHALPRVMHRTRGLAAPRFRAGEPRTRREPDRDMQFPSAVLLVTELHARHPPRVRQLQGGGEQRRGIHTPKLPDQHHHPPRPTHPHQTAKGQNKTGNVVLVKDRSHHVSSKESVETWSIPVWNNGEYATEDGQDIFSKPWNRSKDNTDCVMTKSTGKEAWSSSNQTRNEIGSYFTIQGFDLNYAGVLIGPSVSYDRHTGRLVFLPENSCDPGVTSDRGDIDDEAQEEFKRECIRKQLNVLLKRGVHGLYLFAVDPELQKALWEAADDEQRLAK